MCIQHFLSHRSNWYTNTNLKTRMWLARMVVRQGHTCVQCVWPAALCRTARLSPNAGSRNTVTITMWYLFFNTQRLPIFYQSANVWSKWSGRYSPIYGYFWILPYTFPNFIFSIFLLIFFFSNSHEVWKRTPNKQRNHMYGKPHRDDATCRQRAPLEFADQITALY